MPVIPSDTVRIDERADADTPEVAARIAIATDGVDHLVDPTTRGALPGGRTDVEYVEDASAEGAVETATAGRRRRSAEPPAA